MSQAKRHGRKTRHAAFGGLTEQQEKFVVEYVKNGNNGTDAYIAAGFSKNNATKKASELLNSPKVKARLEWYLQQAVEANKVTIEECVAELKRLAFFDPRNLFKDGQILPLDELPPDVAKAIAAFDVEGLFAGSGKDRMQIGHTVKVKWTDKRAALVDLMKYLGAFKDKDQTPVGDSLKEFVNWLSARKTRIPVNHG